MALGPDAETALREELRGKDPDKKDTALRIVERCWGRSAFAFPELIPLLADPDVEVRRRAVAAVCVSLLGEGGDDSVRRDVDPKLRARVQQLLKPFEKDPDWEIRNWVKDVLEQLAKLQKG